MEYYGSRRHILDWVERDSFSNDLNELLRPVPIVIDPNHLRMPRGRSDPREARLETFGPKVIPGSQIWTSLQRWWLAAGGNTPNWDLASACTLENKPGLLLVEAKANVPELSTAGKRLVVSSKGKNGTGPTPLSQGSKLNDTRIRNAVAEAGRAFADLGIGKAFTATSHYQLANRLAFAWKLACLGVPTTLLYLGFYGDRGIARVGEPFRNEEHWNSIFRAHVSTCLTLAGRELRFMVDGVPVWVAMRARLVLSQSPAMSLRRRHHSAIDVQGV